MSRIRANQITNKGANGAPNFPNGITATGIITATVSNSTLGTLAVTGNATIDGNLGVGGTITYEDVARVDATGISTFREGYQVGPLAGIALTAYKDGSIRTSGIVTAASFVGDGSGLTGAGPTLTGSTNNTVVTVTGANAIQGESKLTFDGNTLDIDNGNIGFKIGGNVNSSGRTNDTYKLARLVTPHYHNAEEPMAIMQVASDGTDNIISHGGSWNGANAATRHVFYTAANDATHTGSERLRIGSAGQLGIAGANYGTAGQVLSSQGASAAPQWANTGTHYLAYNNRHSHTTETQVNGSGLSNGSADGQRDCIVINNGNYHTITPTHVDDIIVMYVATNIYSNWGARGSYWGLGMMHSTATAFNDNRNFFFRSGQHSWGNGLASNGDHYEHCSIMDQWDVSDLSMTVGTTYYLRGIAQVHNTDLQVEINNGSGTSSNAGYVSWLRHYKRNA